jgi:hypothetical protein
MNLADTSQKNLKYLIARKKMLTSSVPLGHSSDDQNKIGKLTTMISNG